MNEDRELPADRDDLDGLLVWAVIRAARGLELTIADALAPLDLTPIQFGALAQLAVEPFLTQAQLAHRILMRPQSAHHLLTVLIDRDLVQRTGERGSGRPNPVRLTTAGRVLLSRAWPRVLAVDQPTALGIESTEHDQLASVIARIMHHLPDDHR